MPGGVTNWLISKSNTEQLFCGIWSRDINISVEVMRKVGLDIAADFTFTRVGEMFTGA